MSSIYMLEAIEYAKKGIGLVYNRPLLGVVIVKGKEIISTGYSQSNKINEGIIDAILHANVDISGATMYLNIEPFYDETNSYALDLIINNDIKCIVIGSYESINTYHAINILRENKIQVIDQVLDKECIKLNEVYFKYTTTKKPFVMLKYSMSLDGRINPKLKHINHKARRFIDYLRKKVKCMIVCVDYLLQHENEYNEYLDKVLIILDPDLKIPINLRLINMQDKPTIFLISEQNSNQEKWDNLKSKGIELLNLYDKHNLNLHILFDKLSIHMIDSILIEGVNPRQLSSSDYEVVDKIYASIIPEICEEQDNGKEFIFLNSLQLSKLEYEIMFDGYIGK